MALGGPDPTTWVWEEALNIFTLDPGFPMVPSRTTVTGVPWLTWRVYTHLRGPSNKVPSNMIHAEGMTFFTSWYAVADVSKELEGASATYFTNGDKVVDSLREDTNDVAKQSTFELASTTLGGVANWLTAQVSPLETWRNKTGHRGDAFQGTGAGAFWNVLDELAHKCQDLVAQLTKDLTTWEMLHLAGGLLKRAGEVLDEGRARWRGGESFTYDTGLGFSVTAPGSELASPGGVVRAIWQAPELVADFASHFPPKYTREEDGWPKSTYLGGVLDQSNGAPRQKLESAAQKVWTDHLGVVDTHGASVAWLLDLTYRQALPYLPTIRTPVHLGLSGGSNAPEDGGAGPGGDGGGDGSTGDNGPSTTTTNSPPPPPPPVTNIGGDGAHGGAFPPPITRVGGPNDFLKVPTGSHVSPDGTVIGPDGKPVLGADGRPIIVPPGSRVNGNGEIIGPRNTGNLEQKDRLRKAYPPPGTSTSGTAGESAMERYLKSLRRTPPPSPPLRAPDTLPMTMSKFDPRANFHSGPGSLGGGRIGVSSELSSSLSPAPGGKTAGVTAATGPPLGGPKTTAGTGTGNGVPFYPPSAGGAGAGAGQGKGERDRTTWIAEDEETWGTDPTVAPGVLGRRKRRARGPGSTELSVNTQRDYTFGLGDGGSAAGQGTGSGTG
ncbi:hypothetical protein [Amycolatopsis orientalis]|uniref:hypothetical protein n=1 Tax=Amycolatopsis orientalis TaxID=31958 RepID=UPI0003FF4D65|nr:hypothetical protein [Amycolatopsis orientalis]